MKILHAMFGCVYNVHCTYNVDAEILMDISLHCGFVKLKNAVSLTLRHKVSAILVATNLNYKFFL